MSFVCTPYWAPFLSTPLRDRIGFWNDSLDVGKKIGELGEKPLGAEMSTKNKPNRDGSRDFR